MRDFMEWLMQKEIWEAIRTRSLPQHGPSGMTMRHYSEIDTFLLMICTITFRVFGARKFKDMHFFFLTNIPEKEVLAGFADEVIYSLFAKQSEDWNLLHEDLE
ncbi:hypothetical protein Tco_0343592 [Tanacetum coccineum]